MPAFKVSRSIQIESDPETVFGTLSDFATWSTWSPWLLSDKDATVELFGDPKDVGGGYGWDGPVVGAGQLQHTRLQPPGATNNACRMDAKLTFTRPWKSESKVDFEIRNRKNANGTEVTQVTWNMTGALPFFLFWMKKKMVTYLSMDFDRGLRMLKELIETGGVASKTEVLGISDAHPVEVIGARGKATLAEIGPAMDKTFSEVKEQLAKAGMQCDCPWVSIYDEMCLETQTVSYLSGIVRPAGSPTPAGLIDQSIPAFPAMHVRHTGRYEHVGNAWSAAHQNLQALKRKPSPKFPGLEYYLNNPDQTPAEELITDLYVPVK